jgi:hypothetical protein
MGTIVGKITTSDGRPIADATVMVESGPTHSDLAAVTDVTGAYALSELEPGLYTLQVNAAGFSTVSGRVPVRHKQITRADLTLEEEEIPVPEMDDQFEDEFRRSPGSQDRARTTTPKAAPRSPRRRSQS